MVGRRQCPCMLKSAVPRKAEVFETPLLLIVADVTESAVVKLPTEDEMGGWWNTTVVLITT